jgi:hypothetical protein
MRVCPVGPNETRMEYDVFRRKKVPEPDFREFMKFYEAVEQEDYDLCVATQRALNVGVYSKGILHPAREVGVLCAFCVFRSASLEQLSHRRPDALTQITSNAY